MKKTIDVIFRAVALATGVAVVALAALKKLELETGMVLLGLGLACLSISLLDNKKD